MPSPKLPYFENALYHVRARSNNKEWFYAPLDTLWAKFLQVFDQVSLTYHAHIVAFVLMDNHYHLLIETPFPNLGAIMNYVQREISRSVGAISGRMNHMFGGTYKGTLVDSEVYAYNVYRYIYQNPVAAGICKRVEEYPYSTLQWLLTGQAPIALSDYIALERAPIPASLPERLEWLNTQLSKQQRDVIRCSLRRSPARFSKQIGLRKTIDSLYPF